MLKEYKYEELLDLAKLRNHKILPGRYENHSSKFEIQRNKVDSASLQCLIQNVTSVRSAKNYNRSK